MTLTIYHLKTCDTCRKAIKALEAAGHDLNRIDVRADGMDQATLEGLIQTHGWEAILNRRSTTWRGLSDLDKTDITNEKAAALMGDHPTLIKRPVIVSKDQTTIGWSKDVQRIWGAG